MWPSGLGNCDACKRFAVQTHLQPLEFVITISTPSQFQTSLKINDLISVSGSVNAKLITPVLQVTSFSSVKIFVLNVMDGKSYDYGYCSPYDHYVEFQNTSVSASTNAKLAVCTSTEIILSLVKNFFWGLNVVDGKSYNTN